MEGHGYPLCHLLIAEDVVLEEFLNQVLNIFRSCSCQCGLCQRYWNARVH